MIEHLLTFAERLLRPPAPTRPPAEPRSHVRIIEAHPPPYDHASHEPTSTRRNPR